jgi:hypothetical protein
MDDLDLGLDDVVLFELPTHEDVEASAIESGRAGKAGRTPRRTYGYARPGSREAATLLPCFAKCRS